MSNSFSVITNMITDLTQYILASPKLAQSGSQTTEVSPTLEGVASLLQQPRHSAFPGRSSVSPLSSGCSSHQQTQPLATSSAG
jgi:hypothetical protein